MTTKLDEIAAWRLRLPKDRRAQAASILGALILFPVVRRLLEIAFFSVPSQFERVEELIGLDLGFSGLPYDHFFIVGASLFNAAVLGTLTVLGVIPLILTARNRWGDFGLEARVLVGVCTVVLAWPYSTYALNPLFESVHLVDRFLVVVLALGVLIRPAVVFLFVPVLLLVISQFGYPIGGYSLTDLRLPLDLLILFGCFMVLSRIAMTIWKQRSPSLRLDFLFLALCMIASSYFVPAWGKLTLGAPWDWLMRERLVYHLAGDFTRGWLTPFPSAQPILLQFAEKWGGLLTFTTLLLEAGALLIVGSRRLAVALLVGLAGLHIGVFALTGIMFWKWIAVDLTLAYLLVRLDTDTVRSFFSPPVFAASVLVILGGGWFFQPVRLAWFDTPIHNTFEIDIVGESGRVWHADDSFFAPHDKVVAFSRLHFLLEEPLLVRSGSTTDLTWLDAMESGPEAFLPLESSAGIVYRDAEQEAEFRWMMETVICANWRKDNKLPMRAPGHIYTTIPPPPVWARQEEPVGWRVRFIEGYYSEGKIDTLRHEVVVHEDLKCPTG